MGIQALSEEMCKGTIMETNVCLSIIVPVYRVEKYLKRCLDSLSLQKLDGIEFLLVDDGSPDHCGEICDEYARKDSRFRVFHKENGGLSSARNYGIDQARGEYLLVVDSDDWVTPDFCSKSYDLAMQNNADIVIFMYQIVKGGRFLPVKTKCLKEGMKTRKEALDLLFEAPGVYVCNKLFRKTLFDGIQFPIGRVFEDQNVTWKLIYKAERVYFTNQVLYYYYMRKKSIIHQETIRSAKDKFEMRMLFYDEIQKTGYSSEILQSRNIGCALGYAMRVKETPNDEVGIRAHEILRSNKSIPQSLLWQQKVMLFLYKNNMLLFNLACTLGGKRIT